LATIAVESERLGRLVSDLLDQSALDAGVLRLVPDWCHLGSVVAAALAAVPGADPALGAVTITGEPVPPLWGDHDRLCQVVVNLVENALRHSSGGTGVTVDLRPEPAGQVALRVSDTGPGLDPEAAAELFGAWRQGGGAGPGPAGRAGLGLGLSIVRGIVGAHGGTVAVEPHGAEAGGRGTTFVVLVPVGPSGEEQGVWEPADVEGV
ncbi:MAG: sensor histidine kinase, partial [Acidimicrobiales bacterium]